MTGRDGTRAIPPLDSPSISRLERSTRRLLRAFARMDPIPRSDDPTRSGSGPVAEVFPGMGHSACAGLLIGAALASALAEMSGRALSGVIFRGILGAVSGGLFGAFVATRRAVAVPGRTATVPTAAGREDLWDPWLDVQDPGEGGPGLEGGAGDSWREMVPERAPVRPRILSAQSGESLPLEDELLPFATAGDRGAIRISGPLGSGKTTALRHLAAVLPPEPGLIVLDDPEMTLLADRSACGLVVYASNDPSHPKHLATYRLAPWSDDELIEYLLGVAKERCASVIACLKRTTDRGLIEGTPELWRIVLDRMIADPTVMDVRHALRQELAPRLADHRLRKLVQNFSLASLATHDVGNRSHLESGCSVYKFDPENYGNRQANRSCTVNLLNASYSLLLIVPLWHQRLMR